MAIVRPCIYFVLGRLGYTRRKKLKKVFVVKEFATIAQIETIALVAPSMGKY